jgi:Tol biopolymer transport system component
LILVLSLGLAACGSTPTATPAPSATPAPPTATATLRPTFTPTVLARATKEPLPTVTPTEKATEPPPSPTTSVAQVSPTATVEATATPAATQRPRPAPGLSGSLLFPVFDGGDQTYHLYKLDLASGQIEKYLEQASQPAVTLVGQRLAWRSWAADRRGLLSRPLGGGDVWQMISFTEAARPDWSPDGQRFVFPSRQEPDRESRLYLFTGTDEEEPFIEIQRHGSPILGRTPVFLPDMGVGDQIVYQGCVEDDCGLVLMAADGTNPRFLPNTFPDDTAPAASPDGSQIAYMSWTDPYWQIKVARSDGSSQQPLTDDRYWNGLPVWSPDGQYIAFVSTRDENWPGGFALVNNAELPFRLWIMDADGQNQRLLHEFSFRMDGLPAGAAPHEAEGWIAERMVWLPAQQRE